MKICVASSSSSTDVFRVAQIVNSISRITVLEGMKLWEKEVSFRVKQFRSSDETSSLS